jgi:hypothetical protein
MKLLFVLLLSSMVLPAQQSVQEMLSEEMSATLGRKIVLMEPVYYKAPIDAVLERAPSSSLRLVDADALWQNDSQELTSATLAKFHPPERLANPHAAVPGNPPPTTLCTGVCVSFSSQGDAAINALTGKNLTNFQAIEALVCSTHPAQVPSGLVLQLANAIGIQTIKSTVGAAVVNQRVGLNWRSIIINTVKYGTITALGIMTSGAFGTVSKGTVFLTALGHEAADDLPKLLAPGAPNPDPFLTGMLDGSSSLSVSPTNCLDVLFSGVYGGPGTSFVTQPYQLMP